MVNMDIKLETWKNKLLDMGKRNRLLNYRDTRRSNLRIKFPGIYDLWDSFVVNEHALEFPFVDEEQQLSFQEENTDTIGGTSSVQTNQSIREQQRTLRNLRSKARTFMEEQGVNVLYLSFGFLRWAESDHSNVHFDAPLVLVPVSLSWESITSPFVMSLHEDEIIVNPTLAYKLDHDFGIKLPEFNVEDSLSSYFESICRLTSTNQWDVIPEVSLGLLSFLKINMYRDLENHREAILKNPIVRALGGDATAVDHDLSVIDHFDHDNNTAPEHTFQVVDADASQQDAILCAKKGYSFVLQGPPGTGKSQTITNIIAECLADGKKVLFVSEKMAALEVVHKRLKDAGLADFCLILHSYKANKKDTLAQLGSVLNLASQKATLSDGAYQRLAQLTADRNRLNEYSTAIFTVIEPLHKTIYEANGILANLTDYADIIFPVDGIQQVTPSIYANYINRLTRFADTVSGMNIDYQSNPWYGANVKFVSNELRHDILAHLNRLIPMIKGIGEVGNAAMSALSISAELSYSNLTQAAAILKLAGQSPKVPVSWLTGDKEIAQLLIEIQESEKAKASFLAQRESILVLHQEIMQNDSAADFTSFSNLASTAEIDAHIDAIHAYIMSAPSCYAIWSKLSNKAVITSLYDSAVEQISAYNTIRQGIAQAYESEIFSIDFDAMYLRFKSEYTSALKFFKSQYRSDKKLVQSLSRERGKKLSDDEVFELLKQLRHMAEQKKWMDENAGSLAAMFGELYQAENTDFDELKRLLDAYGLMHICLESLDNLRITVAHNEEKESSLRQLYETLYSGLETDWDMVRKALDWASIFYKTIEGHDGYGESFLRYICTSDEKIGLCKTYSDQIRQELTAIWPDFKWFTKLFQSSDEWHDMPMFVLTERLTECMNNLAALEEWIDFRTVRNQCYDLGLKEYIHQIETLHIDSTSIVPVFQKRFFRLWLDSVLPEYPVVANFRRKTQESVIQEFDQLDKLQFAIARSRIRSKLINGLPSLEHFTSGVDEISVLKRELNKQRRIMPIRRLFRTIPNLILALKPCLMMSPLSVSLFLEADTFIFDTVIFDEASQVCTENAIGAILRGKQVIIAGDSKQLPPTNFFSATVSDSDFDGDIGDEDEYDDGSAYESILDEAALLPERTLLWHYRSRHEHLIAFSNAKIYKGSLITFPSNVDRAPNVGVEYTYVPSGYYDRGGRKGNVIEAEKVVDLIFEHIRQFPNRSLGVIAFGEVQQLAIDTVLRRRRMEDQQNESFFDEDRQEAFFIKSLENVQGDERDTIIFSIGYAKDASGVMRMNFGPLSKTGGERRLNVAITRAKYNVKLVGSILPTDISTDRISADGPKLLRGYIDFAMNGPSILENEITESDCVAHDSPFEAAVYNFLDRKGYKLATQVGCSGYRIDMAVKHPTLSGRYVLGIECDGAAYHSARTARERDRLRQDVLESMGWKIYRIWSTDWIKDPVTEGQRLMDAVDSAINSYTESASEVQAPIQQEIFDTAESFMSIEDKPVSIADIANPYGFDPPNITDFSILPRNRSGHPGLADCIELLVRNEYPIHYELLCQKISPLLGREKATSVVRKEVDYALRLMGERVARKGDFFYPASFAEIPVRQANGRNIKHISTDELAAAMLRVLSKCVGTTRTALIDETTRALGFNRRGTNIARAMNDAFEQLKAEGKIQDIDGKVKFCD